VKKLLISFLLATVFLPVCAQKKVNFDEVFQKASQGKSSIDIPPLKELLHIMLAITKSGLNNDDMVNQKGDYYQDVLNHFRPFANEPIIKTFDSHLNKLSKLRNELFNTRVMFTEIDHNYVSPPTNENKAAIDNILKNRGAG
jgi:hypothetical protein